MSLSRGCAGPAWLAALAMLVSLGSAARAADIETRDFQVSVGGKSAGEVHMTIQRHDNGTIWMRCDTDIAVKIALKEYKFIYRGREIWKEQRLVQFDSTTDDNGKRYTVAAVAENGGVKVKVNNTEKVVSANIWPTSYWTLPDQKLRGGELAILDADTGTELSGKLQFVANEKIKIGGQVIPLNHYRVTGKVSIDLWYDGSDRLVRQEWMEQGHKTTVELVRVRR